MAGLRSFLRTSADDVDTRTVQLFITDEDVANVLLVHEKEETGRTGSLTDGRVGGKPAGWGIPGGGVNKTMADEDLVSQIFRFLPVYGIEGKLFEQMQLGEGIDIVLALTAIKEGLEELGLLIIPVTILFEEQNFSNHKVVVMSGRVVAGKIQKRSIETDDCNWFPFNGLPQGTYHSHRRRIIRALKVLGRDDLAHKVTVEVEEEQVQAREVV